MCFCTGALQISHWKSIIKDTYPLLLMTLMIGTALYMKVGNDRQHIAHAHNIVCVCVCVCVPLLCVLILLNYLEPELYQRVVL